jgi:hypothetical protein
LLRSIRSYQCSLDVISSGFTNVASVTSAWQTGRKVHDDDHALVKVAVRTSKTGSGNADEEEAPGVVHAAEDDGERISELHRLITGWAPGAADLVSATRRRGDTAVEFASSPSGECTENETTGAWRNLRASDVLMGAPPRSAPCLLGILCALGALVVPAAGRSAGVSRSLDAKALIRKATTLTTPKMSHWAIVARQVDVHRLPTVGSPLVTRLDTTTADGTQNIVRILTGATVRGGGTWYLVRLAILPNNSTGWVPRSALGKLYILHTHLYVDRGTQTATLKRDGRTIFTTRIGVGRPYWPTPPGSSTSATSSSTFTTRSTGRSRSEQAHARRSSPTGPAAATSAFTARTSRSSSRAASRTAASGSRTRRSSRSPS